MKKYFFLFVITLLIAFIATAKVALKSNKSEDFREIQDKQLKEMPMGNRTSKEPVFVPKDKFKDEGDTQPFI